MRKLILPLALLAATPALAHHPMGFESPQTVAHGLLSGLAHPVIGIDHLAFVVLVGLAAAASGRLAVAPLTYVGATILGTVLQLWGMNLPLAELVIAGSVVALGALLVLGRQVSGTAALAAFAAAGLFPSRAYGEAVLGSEMGPIAAYLLGFAAIQFAIATGVATLAARATVAGAPALQARLAAAICLGVGLVFLLEEVEALIL
jgi:urease accessory protein